MHVEILQEKKIDYYPKPTDVTKTCNNWQGIWWSVDGKIKDSLVIEIDKGHFYACRNSPRKKDVKRVMIRMHNLLMPPPEGFKIDHKDRNGLNNQRGNLRFCTPSQNSANTRVRLNKKSSKYFGVFKHENAWVASICVNYKHIRLGRFPYTLEGEITAAKAYNDAAIKYKGEFANLNEV